MNFTPRPFQARAVSEMTDLYRQYAEHLLVMPPGAGKTKTFFFWLLTVCEDFPVWVLIHEEDLLDQWLNDAREFVAMGYASSSDFCAVSGGDAISLENKKFLGLKAAARVVFCMDRRVSGSIQKATAIGLAPRVVCMDEFHLMCTRDGARSIRRWGYSVYGDAFKVIGLTGSPVAHEAEYIHPEDYCPREQWSTPVTNGELTREGFWARQEYMELSPSYLDKAKGYFKGLWEELEDGKTIATSGRAVMKALHKEHIQGIIDAPRRANETTLIICADINHAERIAASLRETWGDDQVEVVTGKPKKKKGKRTDQEDVFDEAIEFGGDDEEILYSARKPRREVLKMAREGNVRAVCIVGCWLSGIDIPNAKTIHFLTPFGSLPRFLQTFTRIIRPGRGECEGLTARCYDWALNFGKHPLIVEARFDEEAEFTSGASEYRDPKSRMCLNKACLFVHKSTPMPRKPGDKPKPGPNQTRVWTKAKTTAGEYADGTPIGGTDPLLCCDCDQPVYVDRDAMAEYVDWKMDGKDPDLLPKSMGLSIGVQTSQDQVPATYEILVEMGFYGGAAQALRNAKDKAVPPIVDRSLEWEVRREVCKNAYSKARKTDRISSVLGSVATSGVLSIPKSSLKTNSKTNYQSLVKAVAFSLVQSFNDDHPIVNIYGMTLMYPLSDFVYCENSEGFSICLAQDEAIPHGYRPAKATRTKSLKTIFLQGFSRFLAHITNATPDLSGLIELLEGWITPPLDAFEEQHSNATHQGEQGRADSLKETIEILVECLELIREADSSDF
jgi:superfamily II DNA or RNA helicase